MKLISKYLQTSIQTQNRGKIVVLLYESAIKNLKRAIMASQNNNLQIFAESINKAIAIIHELNITLDMDKGQAISQNLRSLYNFFVRELTKIGITRDTAAINRVIHCLDNLHQGWSAIAS